MSGSARDPYAVVGEAVRQANERAKRVRLSGGDLRLLMATIALVSSWSRLVDDVYVGDVADQSGLSERYVRARLAKLAELDLVVWEPRRGRGVRSRLGLPATSITGSHDVPVSEVEKPERTTPKTGTLRAEKRNPWSSEDRRETPRRDPEQDLTVVDRPKIRDRRSATVDELECLVDDLGDADASTLGTFIRHFGHLPPEYVEEAARVVDAHPEVSSPAGYAFRVIAALALGYGRLEPAA